MFSIKTGYVCLTFRWSLSQYWLYPQDLSDIPVLSECRSFILNELGHGGSRDRKRGWIAIFAHCNLTFDRMNRHAEGRF